MIWAKKEIPSAWRLTLVHALQERGLSSLRQLPAHLITGDRLQGAGNPFAEPPEGCWRRRTHLVHTARLLIAEWHIGCYLRSKAKDRGSLVCKEWVRHSTCFGLGQGVRFNRARTIAGGIASVWGNLGRGLVNRGRIIESFLGRTGGQPDPNRKGICMTNPQFAWARPN